MLHEIIQCPGKEKVSLECFVLDSALSLGQFQDRPAVVICPGGGYVYLSPREAEPVAAAYLSKGIDAFILRYSLGWEAAVLEPMKELDWALALVRERAQEWSIAPGKVFTLGFSAGGHLALYNGLYGKERPDGMVLGYPAVKMEGKNGLLFTKLLLGKDETSGEENLVDLTRGVTKDAPPLFLFTTAEDSLTYGPSLELAMRYAEKGIPVEIHIFQKGPHGLSLANEAAADGSSQVLSRDVEKWLDLSADWIFSVSGPLEFADRSTSRMGEELRKLGISAGSTPGNA